MPKADESEYSEGPVRSGPAELKQDELIEKLIPDPAAPSDVRVLVGFLGKSVRTRYWRLYLNPELSDYLEICEDDVVHSQPVSTKQEPTGGTMLWVKRDAKLQRTRAESPQYQTQSLQGGQLGQVDIIRAWKDEAYRMSLTEAERASLPPNPAGFIELVSGEELEVLSQARRGTVLQGCNTRGSCGCTPACPTHIYSRTCFAC